MNCIYTDEFLISEVKRFVKEKGRVPSSHEMCRINGYPSYSTYIKHFGSWNNILLKCGLNMHTKNKGTRKFILKKRNACPNCKSVAIVYRKRVKNYICNYCSNIFDKPIIIELLHNKMGQCIEHLV